MRRRKLSAILSVVTATDADAAATASLRTAFAERPTRDYGEGHGSPAVTEKRVRRGYQFNSGRISRSRTTVELMATDGQLRFEWARLKRKLRSRAPVIDRTLAQGAGPEPHPLFRIVPGAVSEWERSAQE